MIEAEKVLLISKDALKMMQNETDIRRFRVEYYACVSSLRSVGHVLDKVDKTCCVEFEQRLNSWWKQLNVKRDENKIFHEFIDLERNNLLKEGNLNFDTGYSSELLIDSYLLIGDDLIYVPIKEGVFQGEDIRDVLELAVQWWEKQIIGLTTIKRK